MPAANVSLAVKNTVNGIEVTSTEAGIEATYIFRFKIA
jgi:hypothetical protein